MKKILVVSNESFSDSSSNGRTIKSFFLNISKQNLAQFYLHGVPDRDFCENYFCVSDRAALNAFLCKKEKEQHRSDVTTGQVQSFLKPKRNYRNLVLRNLVWQSMRWWEKDFTAFLDDFAPDIVLLQAGDAPFMYKIARRIANKYRAKLVLYNSESYVLKKVMYASSGENMFWHSFLMGSLKRQYGRFMKAVDYCLYNTEALEAAYQAKYPHPGKSDVLYTNSTLSPMPDDSTEQFALLYCGNLGVGRVKPINELARVLYEVDKTARLDICGKFPNEESQEMLCANPNVVYHGFLDYSEILKRMSEASMLVHCENNARLENLRYAFSTKIADSLASTRPFLVYASGEYPFVQYLLKNRCAHVAENADELKQILRNCIDDKIYRCQYTQNAYLAAEKNHNLEENCRKIEKIFNSI